MSEAICPHCNRNCAVEDFGFYTCPHCHQQFDYQPAVSRATPPTIADQPLFGEDGILINANQVIVPGSIISVRNIAAVSAREIPAKRGWPLLWMFFGVPFAATGSYIFGGVFIASGLIALATRRDKYALIIQTSGGPHQIDFNKRDKADRAAYALSQAMAQ